MTLEYGGIRIKSPRDAFEKALAGAGNEERKIYKGTGDRTRASQNESVAIAHSLFQHQDAAMAVAERWIGEKFFDPIKWVFRPHSQYAMGHSYAKDESLALALIGEVESQPGKRQELALAKLVYRAPGLSDRLNSILTKLRLKYERETKHDMYKDFTKRYVGKYLWYYGGPGKSFRHAFRSPEKYSVGAKVGVMHDLCDYYHAQKNSKLKKLVTVERKRSRASVLKWGDEKDEKKRTAVKLRNIGRHRGELFTEHMEHAREFFKRSKDPKGWRYPNGTLNEFNASIQLARYLKRHIVWGPSFTTARMMQIASSVKISDGSGEMNALTWGEMDALTWAIFSFWQTAYKRAITGIHTFHSVRDMGRNFGVAFHPFDEIPSVSPGFKPDRWAVNRRRGGKITRQTRKELDDLFRSQRRQ